MKVFEAYSRVLIAAASLTIVTSLLFMLKSRSQASTPSSSLLTYTKAVTWDTLWLDPRLKAFKLNDTEKQDLSRCLAPDANDPQCPSYFAWIHEDLIHWSQGITRENMDEAIRKGDFRVVIVGGKVYHQAYHECIQTRDQYTLKGLLLLLEKVAGQIPDVEMVFVCNDFPQVLKWDYPEKVPPPIFSYCTTRSGIHADILFPDWSFWGWPEVRIRPWMEEREEIFQGGSKKDWFDKEPIAYWKGNLWVMTPVREELLGCNNTQNNVVVYYLDWAKEGMEGFRTSSLSQQCHVRYKVYAEGRGWSCSLKYITACGSTLIHIEPDFLEFFARSWLPYVHYWPVNRPTLCPGIKYAVDWGNAYPAEAAAIGQCGKSFLEKQLTMDHVYSYMVHLIQAYAKLQKFQPVAPEGVEPLSLKEDMVSSSERQAGVKLCEMVPRNKAFVDETLARQVAGYRNLSVL